MRKLYVHGLIAITKVDDSMRYTLKEGNYRQYGMQVNGEGVIFTFEAEKEEECRILLYGKEMEVTQAIQVPARYCRGAVRSVLVQGLRAGHLKYNYEKDGKVVTDPYATRVIGRERWNDPKRMSGLVCGGYAQPEFDWGEDMPPEVPRSRMMIYKLHVRGFTMDAGLRGRERGSFQAVGSYIPYFKKLGVTTIEFMPVYEFEERMFPETPALPEYVQWEVKEGDRILPEQDAPEPKVNYWGYAPGNYFAVKSSYAAGKDAAREFKTLIKELHAAGIECVMELYVEGLTNQCRILDILRYWMSEYHVDGFHLLGEGLPVTLFAQDPWLRRTKLFYTGFDSRISEAKSSYPHLFVCSDEYLYPVRGVLNQIGGDVGAFACQQRKQHRTLGFVNYIADQNGFTLADLFSYEEKHNEANGEENRDGTIWNMSSNCGAEGRSGKKSVREARERQLRNAIAVLMTGQGVPLLFEGDEQGNSQDGNNNAYCQDNPTGWVNWKRNRKYAWLTEFTARMAAFRREHPVIASETPRVMSDFLRKGFPDLSYHGENAWTAAPSGGMQPFGVMYCGSYEELPDGGTDDFVYIGYNFQTASGRLALPKLPENGRWRLCMDTARGREPFLPEEEAVRETQIPIRGRSVVILVGRKNEESPAAAGAAKRRHQGKERLKA